MKKPSYEEDEEGVWEINLREPYEEDLELLMLDTDDISGTYEEALDEAWNRLGEPEGYRKREFGLYLVKKEKKMTPEEEFFRALMDLEKATHQYAQHLAEIKEYTAQQQAEWQQYDLDMCRLEEQRKFKV